jgi:hypothetical protein
MSSTIFQNGLQKLKESDRYSKQLITQFEDLAERNGGKPPKQFTIKNVGRRELAQFLYELGYEHFDIFAPNGSSSSDRAIVIH